MDEAAEDGEAVLADDDAAAMDAEEAPEAGGSGGDRFAGGGGGGADDDRDERWQCVPVHCVACLYERMQSPALRRCSSRSGRRRPV